MSPGRSRILASATRSRSITATSLWSALKNNYWPAHYFVDAQGRVRYHHFGEGEYAMSERVIRQLLAEAGHAPQGCGDGQGERVGRRGRGRARRGRVARNLYRLRPRRPLRLARRACCTTQPKAYAAAPLSLNDWSLEGTWLDSKQSARSLAAGAKISFRFHARDLHLVLGSASGKPVRFRVTIDGAAPGRDAGVDVAANGIGAVKDQRLYQLVRQKGAGARPHLHDRIPRPRRRGLLVHLRVNGG